MSQIIVYGVTGTKASGKGVFSTRARDQHGYAMRSCSDEIRVEWAKRGVSNPTVHQLIALGNEERTRFGIGYWARRSAQTLIDLGYDRISIDGLRHPDEVAALNELAGPGFRGIAIVAPKPLRKRWFMARRRDGDPVTDEEFDRLDDTDRGIGQPWHGQQVDRTIACMPFENVYNNCGSLEEYLAWIDADISGFEASLRR